MTTAGERIPVEDEGARRVESAVVRFAGDSGDGVQLTGSRFTQSVALAGNDLATLPDFPAEIRAPAGTTFGVSSFQIQFGSRKVSTPGDAPDVLVALNPAALKVHLSALRKGGTLVVNTSAFIDRNLTKAGYESNPLEDGSLDGYRVLPIEIGRHTLEAVSGTGLGNRQAQQCKNMWALGLAMWMYGHDPEPTIAWVRGKFENKPDVAEANVAALQAGYNYGENTEIEPTVPLYDVPRADIPPGHYSTVTGAEGISWGLVTGAARAGLPLFFGSYPITPASNLLHTLSRLSDHGVVTFQAEDEIAAACSAIGASFAGQLGATASSGPGVSLKGEAMGLAVATELPLVLINCQRAGPSTGMPTKTEQSDLYQALYGRHGDSPLPVLAPCTPADSFFVAVEAVRLASRYMTPVMVLADGYLVNASEPWEIPDVSEIEPFPVSFHSDPDGFHPFLRNPETLARAWALPGTAGLEHRIGGLERDAESGHISYDPDNHQHMTDVRAEKIRRISHDIPAQQVSEGPEKGRLAVVGWGSTYGAIHEAVKQVNEEGANVAHIHLRYLNPFPANLGELLKGYDRILVPELNAGQLVKVLRGEFLVPAEGFNQVSGLPFGVENLVSVIRDKLEDQ